MLGLGFGVALALMAAAPSAPGVKTSLQSRYPTKVGDAAGPVRPAPGTSNYADRLALLAIVSPERAVSASEIHRAVGRAVRRRMGIQLLSTEEMFVARQSGLAGRVRDCGPDVQCIARRMRQFRARLGLIVVLDRSISPGVLSLQLIDTDLSQLVGETLDELHGDGRPLGRMTAQTGHLLDRAGYIESGRLRVSVDPPAAQIRLQNGLEPDLGSPNMFTLAPGRYTIMAEHPGFDPSEAQVDIQRGQEARVELRLDERTSVWASPWLWVTVGVVVAGAVTAGTLVATQPDAKVCFSFPGRTCD